MILRSTASATIATAIFAALVTASPSRASAQSITIPDSIERLSAKAKDSVNVTLDGTMLQFAGQFLNSNNGDERQAKSLVSKLKSIKVRSLEFVREGEYSPADVEAVRSQLKAPWTRILDTREDKERLEVYARQGKDGLDGIVVLATEQKELTIISIDGAIDLKELSSLGGKFGIRSIPGVTDASAAPGGAKDSAE